MTATKLGLGFHTDEIGNKLAAGPLQPRPKGTPTHRWEQETSMPSMSPTGRIHASALKGCFQTLAVVSLDFSEAVPDSETTS